MKDFRKADRRPGRIAYEVAGLKWLAAAGPDAVPVVELTGSGANGREEWLTERHLSEVAPTPAAAEEFGRRLAFTHAAGAEYLGVPPPGFKVGSGVGWDQPLYRLLINRSSDQDQVLNSSDASSLPRKSGGVQTGTELTSEQHHSSDLLHAEGAAVLPESGSVNTPIDSAALTYECSTEPVDVEGAAVLPESGSVNTPIDSAALTYECSTEPVHTEISGQQLGSTDTLTWGEFYGNYAIRPYVLDQIFSAEQAQILHRLCDRLEAGDFEHPQPALVSAGQVARIHGDLWSGNVMWVPEGATLIDPQAHGDHGEEDLGTLALFGCPFWDRIVAAYNEVSPLADGWQGRVHLHEMHMQMIHCVLFGGGYIPETIAVAQRYL